MLNYKTFHSAGVAFIVLLICDLNGVKILPFLETGLDNTREFSLRRLLIRNSFRFAGVWKYFRCFSWVMEASKLENRNKSHRIFAHSMNIIKVFPKQIRAGGNTYTQLYPF